MFWDLLRIIEDFIWSYLGFTLLTLAGIYLTILSKGMQFRVLKCPLQTLRDLNAHNKDSVGVHPVKLYFASIGGMIGLGNIVYVIAAITIGGPGALFWMWIASFAGMLIKYSEIYLGIKYRVKDSKGRHHGGSVYFLPKAFAIPGIGILAAILLCIYGAEVLQFTVITDIMVEQLPLNKMGAIGILLALVLYVSLGGVERLANTCTVLMPVFMLMYIIVCIFIIATHYMLLPEIFWLILKSAFTGSGVLGGSLLLAAQHGISKAVYSGDIGIGYDSIIQAETRNPHPEQQAKMTIFALFTDTFICTLSVLVVLCTGVWKMKLPQMSDYIATALEMHIPYMKVFVGLVLFLAGFTTLIAYFTVGVKCAQFISQKYGRYIYIAYSVFAFTFFSFFDQSNVALLMSVSGGLLLLINLSAILKLRHEIKFN